MSVLKSLESLDGFSSAVKAINQVPQDLLFEMCEDVASMLQYKTSFIPLDHYKMCLSHTCSDSDIDPKLVVNGLTHVFRSAATGKVTAESLYNELKSNGTLKEDVLTTLKRVWSEQGHLVSNSNLDQSFTVGQLLDIQWKLSVGMSSTNCKGLNSPFVTALVKSTDSFGKVSSNSFEMTLSEFKKFATEMRDISTIMETM
ncbi:Hypothetical predicted protein [Paramuricea clavata]|uniref:COMM domain-containing protein 6 n=1 Tax=Paramuricea clavata TaxID=317549 RepID=A0A6S7HZ92_PARCT|nr:Hypothetical predicted protein [Paramuricea clavata]